MTRLTKISSARVIVCSMLLLIETGCTVIYNVPMREVEYRDQPKFDLNVQVLINEELRKAQWMKTSMGDQYILPLGKALALNTEKVARATFQVIEVIDTQSFVSEGFDAVLIPKVINIKRNRPVTGMEDQTTSVIFEWKLEASNGDIVWLDTIIGQGTGPWSRYGTNAGTEQIEKLLDDLFLKSFEAITNSPEIKEFVATRSSAKKNFSFNLLTLVIPLRDKKY